MVCIGGRKRRAVRRKQTESVAPVGTAGPGRRGGREEAAAGRSPACCPEGAEDRPEGAGEGTEGEGGSVGVLASRPGGAGEG